MPNSQLNLPPRAPIYGPSPIGVDTIEIESFSSYFLRLAATHRVTGCQLLKFKSPHCDRVFKDGTDRLNQYPIKGIRDGTAVCSPGGGDLAQALALLTGRPAVEKTSFEFYRGEINTSRLIRRSSAWCPLCLQEDMIPYERQLWCINIISSCPKPEHQVRLQTTCPHCQTPTERRLLENKLFHCVHCGNPVYLPKEAYFPPASNSSIEESKVMAAFFQSVFEGRISLSKHDIANDLKRFGESQGARSLDELSKLFGTAKGQLCAWFLGRHTPSLLRFLEICTTIRVTPLQLLGEEEPPATLQREQRQSQSRFWTRAERKVSRYDRRDLARKIVALANAHPTLRASQLAQLAGFGGVQLYDMFPPLVHAINKRAAKARRQRSIARIDAMKAEAAKVAENLLSQGITPTQKLVSNAMIQPGSMRNPELRKFVNELISTRSHPPQTASGAQLTSPIISQ